MEVTIAICTWNRSELLARTLESFNKLVIPAGVDVEVLVIDNNSTDDTQDVLAKCSMRLPLRHFVERSQGQSFARNRAIAEAQGEIVIWTDDDVCPEPDWVAAILEKFERDQAEIVFGIVKPHWLAAVPDWFGERFWGNFALLDYGAEPFVVTDERHTFNGANHAARLDVLRSLGGYREDLGLVGDAGGGEDSDFFLRAFRAGMKIVYEPKAVVGHMIESWRCTRYYHRRRTWLGCRAYYNSLRSMREDIPRVLGIPRYLYRFALGNARDYLLNVVRRDRGAAFYHELKLIQFAGLLGCAVRSPGTQTKGKHMPAIAKSSPELPATMSNKC